MSSTSSSSSSKSPPPHPLHRHEGRAIRSPGAVGTAAVSLGLEERSRRGLTMMPFSLHSGVADASSAGRHRSLWLRTCARAPRTDLRPHVRIKLFRWSGALESETSSRWGIAGCFRVARRSSSVHQAIARRKQKERQVLSILWMPCRGAPILLMIINPVLEAHTIYNTDHESRTPTAKRISCRRCAVCDLPRLSS